MKLYKTTIKPLSAFGTPLKGDTLFGQLCWSIRYAFGISKLETLLKDYESAPFLIVSDGFAKGYLPKPKLPNRYLNEGDDKKANRKKVWLAPSDLESGNFANGKTAAQVGEDKSFITMHNSINYQTFTTDENDFAPYGVDEFVLCEKDIYFLIDEQKISVSELKEAFALLAKIGYGKDTTIGKGRFEFGEFEAINTKDSKTVMALSPFCPQGIESKECFYEPFIRFGKKGGDRANQNPFKKPIIMADTAGVIVLNEPKSYIGRAIKGHSTHADIVHQGYAIAYPIREIV
jgi:CRISPR-associated protein Csm4